MNGKIIENTKKSYCYQGEAFELKVSKAKMDGLSRKTEQESFAKKVKVLIQKNMKKYFDTIINGEIYQKDFDKINNELMDDLHEYNPEGDAEWKNLKLKTYIMEK